MFAPADPISIVDKVSGSQASISLKHGFNCFRFRAVVDGRVVDVIDSAADFPDTGARPSGNGTPILFPFPNRIAGGRFQWDGKDYQIPLAGNAPNAIHGFAHTVPWRVIARTEDTVTAEFQLSRDNPAMVKSWPADCRIQLRYGVLGATLRMDITISNPDDRPLPWGFGTHTYYKLPLAAPGTPAQCLVTAPAYEEWVLDQFIPTGERRKVSDHADLTDGAYFPKLKLDDVLTGLRYDDKGRLESSIMDEGAGLEVVQQCSKQFRELVMYTPPNRNAICMEPYTCTTDAINLHARNIDGGLQILPPGQLAQLWIQITARPVLV